MLCGNALPVPELEHTDCNTCMAVHTFPQFWSGMVMQKLAEREAQLHVNMTEDSRIQAAECSSTLPSLKAAKRRRPSCDMCRLLLTLFCPSLIMQKTLFVETLSFAIPIGPQAIPVATACSSRQLPAGARSPKLPILAPILAGRQLLSLGKVRSPLLRAGNCKKGPLLRGWCVATSTSFADLNRTG